MSVESIAPATLSRDELEQLLEEADHLNDEHGDTITFVARYAGGWADVTSASVTAADANGFEFSVDLTDGTSTVRRIDFPAPMTDVDGVRMSFYGMLGQARERAGDTVPATSLEIELAEVSTLTTFQTKVERVTDLSPRLREVTFAGGLEGFEPMGPDQFFLVTPSDESGRAYYTVRRWRPEVGEMDMWFVLHGDHGPLSRWAARASAGDGVSVWGPRASFEPPPDTQSIVLIADDTGLPAVAAIMDATHLPVTAIVETYDEEHVIDVPGPVEWLFRGDEAPGTGGRLVSAVEAWDADLSGTYCFGAGESREMTAIRKHLRNERSLPREWVQMTAYWRRPASTQPVPN